MAVSGGSLSGESAAELFLDAGVESDHAQTSIVGQQRPHQRPSQRLPGRFHQRHRILADGGGVQQALQDGGQVANRHLLAQKLLQHLLHLAQAQQLGHQLFAQLGMALAQPVQQALGLLPAQQLVGMLLDDLRQMGRHHRGLVHHSVARGQRLLAQAGNNPARRDPECRLVGGEALQLREEQLPS